MAKKFFLKNDGLIDSVSPKGYQSIGIYNGKLNQKNENENPSEVGSPLYTTYDVVVSSYPVVLLSELNGTLFRIGEKYEIRRYSEGENLSDVGGPTAGSESQYDGTTFTSTGIISYGLTNSSVSSLGNLIIESTLENTLGFNPDWTSIPKNVGYHYFDFPTLQDENKVSYTKVFDEKGSGYYVYREFGVTQSFDEYPSSYVNSILLHSSGNVIIGGGTGSSQDGFYEFGYIKKLDNNGYPSITWVDPSLDGDVQCMIELQDGGILIGGNFTGYLKKIDIYGDEVTSFNNNIEDTLNGVVQSLVEQPDGKILVAGSFTTFNNGTKSGIIRLNSNGTEDTNFNNGNNGVSNGNGSVKTVTLDNGKILIGGNFFNYNGNRAMMFCRLNSDGTYDTDFMTNLLNNHYGMFNSTVDAIAVQDDGYVIGGNFNNWGRGPINSYNPVIRNRIIKIKKTGTEDTSFYFNMSGTILETDNGLSGQVKSILIEKNGDILIGGSMTTVGEQTTAYNIVRLKSNGRISKNFLNLDGFNSTVNTIAASEDGKEIWCGGYFTDNNNGNGVTNLAKVYSPSRLVIQTGTANLNSERIRIKIYN